MYPMGMSKPQPRRLALLGFVALVLSYGMVIVFFVAMETALIFPAPKESPTVMAEAAKQQGAQEVWVDSDDGETLYGWRIGSGERIVILFTGNASGVGLEPDRYRQFETMGYAVLHLNYPGYPGSTGKPSEQGLEAAARAAWSEATRTHSPEQIVLAGKSLGGFAAISLAADLSQAGGPVPLGLIVESSFSSVEGLASEMYPWLPIRWFLQNRMMSIDKTPQVRFPVLLLHGIDDDLIRPHHSQQLNEGFPDSELVEIPGLGHNDNLGLHPSGAAAIQRLLDR